MTVNKTARFVLGIFFAILFISLTIRQISFAQVKMAFEGASIFWVLAVLFVFAFGFSCRIERWRLMLKQENPRLTWHNCAGPLLASFAVNNMLPFRAGDVLRCFAFNGKLGATSGVVIATLFVERLLDLLMVLVLLSAALAIFGLDTHRFAGFGSAMLIAGTVTIMVVLLFPDVFTPLARVAVQTITRFAPKKGRKLGDEINRSLTTLRHLAQGRSMLKLISWSAMVWLAEGCVFWFAALALPSIDVPLASWLALPVGTLATLIPSTPGYVGTFDFFTARAMIALGNAAGAATAYALLVHALLWFPPTLIGGAYLILRPVKKIS